MNQELAVHWLESTFTIHRWSERPRDFRLDELPSPWFVASTRDEFSLVCASHCDVASERRQGPYVGFQVEGPLAFDLIGILANLTAVLARANISVFVVSSYDTDTVFVPGARKQDASGALRDSGYRVNESQSQNAGDSGGR